MADASNVQNKQSSQDSSTVQNADPLKDPKQSISPEEFLLSKELEIGKVLTPRFRTLFYKKLKEKKTYLAAWAALYD